MAMPPMSLSTASSSEAKGQNTTNSGFDNSGFVVNFGGTGGVTTGVPGWALVLAAGVVLWAMTKKR